MYDKGEGVPKDDKEAVTWYRRAAEQGDAFAQNNLGFMYEYGEGVLQNYVLAHMWFNIASLNGHKKSKQNYEIIEKKMSTLQIQKAEGLATECMKKNFKGC